MRQFFSWRIWAACVVLIALALLIKTSLPSTANTANTAKTDAATHMVDFISVVFQMQPSSDFSMTDGVTTGLADVVIDGQRTMHIVAGTPGSITCPDATVIGSCVVLADLLGDAVVWFAIVPVEPGPKVSAPPIAQLMGNGVVRLTNGWLVRTATTVDRQCPQDTVSLTEFVKRLGSDSTTVIDVSKQRVTAVRCAAAATATS